MKVINVTEKLTQIDEHWQPHVVGELNGQQVKLAKLEGSFDWHHHESEDEMFYIISGELELQFRDRVVKLREGEFCVVPKGVEHRPVAESECHVMLFEPATTLNTGNIRNERTVEVLKDLR